MPIADEDLPNGEPRRARAASPERALQKALVAFYRVGVWPGQAILFAVPNGEARHAAVAAMLTGISAAARNLLPDDHYLDPYGQGVIPGPTDLILMTAGGVSTYVEVKVPTTTVVVDGKDKRRAGGSLQRGQKLFATQGRALGHDIRLVTSLETWADLLEEKGLRLRVARWWRLSPVVAPPAHML